MSPSTTLDRPVVATEGAPAERDPLDIPYGESGLPKAVWTNPIYPNQTFYYTEVNEAGEAIGTKKIVFVGGLARYNTPREELVVIRHLTRLNNGNHPGKWRGTTLDPEDRWLCDGENSCSFSTLNLKAGMDHQKFWKHPQKIAE